MAAKPRKQKTAVKAKKPRVVPPLLPITCTELFIVSPRQVFMPRVTMEDKKEILNLNNYRNWQGHQSNDIKKQYKIAIREQLEGVGLQTPVNVEIRIFKKTRGTLDKVNVDSVSRKFLYDVMTEMGVWRDDSDTYIYDELIKRIEIDKLNPRVEFRFKTVKEEKQ